MTVILDLTISLDGFVTGPAAGPDNGLGDGGLPLHEWAIGDRTAEDVRVLAELTAATGAVVMGRHTFDVVDGPHGWDDDVHYGADQGDRPPPCFVVTHHPPVTVRLTDRMTIVTTGLRDALDQAAAAAGDEDVFIMGGGELGASALREDVVDRLHVHVAPLLLGAGTPLFDRVPRRSLRLDEAATVVTRNAAHLFYDLVHD
ncbi:dihydrofolate reductase family protein [Cellulomonas fengjieae]|uniref:dihydrofolate reductase family protein n=1 Tax=Cellulomonas fengjieae TaxID=2819978 RepID=UPI001AAE571B|nr:dihydrofolate reductase family protein [Cellulomonas fengjieae]MBO3103920.1 dihydrofolate reductase family protein [Cellulomonas fengjieae]